MGKAWIIGIAIYAAVGVVTFGHAAAGRDQFRVQFCATVDQRLKNPSDCYSGPPAVVGMLSGILWPLYWSWEAWS